MSSDLVIKMEGQEWRFSGDECEKLKSCSHMVKDRAEEVTESDPDTTEDIEIPITDDRFKPAQVDECIKYLKSHSYNPPIYGKVISNQIEKNIEDEAGRTQVSAYDRITVAKLLSCADFLQIPSIITLCLFRVAIEIFIDTNQAGAVNNMMEKFNITATYTVQTEVDLKAKFPFLSQKAVL